MNVRVLGDERSLEAFVGEPAVVGFVRRRDRGSRELRALLDALAAERGPRIGFAVVDVDVCSALADRFAIERVPTVILFDDQRHAGRLEEPITRPGLEQLIATRLG